MTDDDLFIPLVIIKMNLDDTFVGMEKNASRAALKKNIFFVFFLGNMNDSSINSAIYTNTNSKS
jgi:hypothetical protein